MVRLLIKTHTKTGLNYLCITTRKDYKKYLGSGSYWSKHLRTHGKDNVATTLLYESEENNAIFKYICEFYSELYNVVESNLWANLVVEDGNNWAYKNVLSSDTRSKMIEGHKRFRLNSPNKYKQLLKLKSINSKRMHKNFTEEEKANRISKIKLAYTKSKRLEHSEKIKNSITQETLKLKSINSKRMHKNFTEEEKKARSSKISKSLKNSKKFKAYTNKLKEERLGSKNPSAKSVLWDGIVFKTITEFKEYIIKNKVMAYYKAYSIIKENKTETRRILPKESK